MSEIKVQCDCGQKIKFDVDPAYTRIPFPVNCPVCGADCLDKANQMLGALVPAAAAPVAVGAPSVATPAPRLRIGGAAQAPSATAEAPASAPMPSARPGAFRPGAAPATAADGTPKKKPNFGLGIVGGIAGAIVGAGLFYLVFKLTGFRLGLMGLAVGFLTGLGARILGGEQDGPELGYIAGALAVAGVIGAQYFVARSWWNEASSMKPTSGYEVKVDEAKKVVAMVPTGSDQEIRVYLAQQMSDEDEKVKPADIDAETVKEFKGQLPEFQDLASGKITKVDYEKQHAQEIAKEKEEANTDEGTFKAIFVLVLVNRVSLACMCPGAGLAFKMCA
jgi:hypothetical protein